jgi:hypothetical protein
LDRLKGKKPNYSVVEWKEDKKEKSLTSRKRSESIKNIRKLFEQPYNNEVKERLYENNKKKKSIKSIVDSRNIRHSLIRLVPIGNPTGILHRDVAMIGNIEYSVVITNVGAYVVLSGMQKLNWKALTANWIRTFCLTNLMRH